MRASQAVAARRPSGSGRAVEREDVCRQQHGPRQQRPALPGTHGNDPLHCAALRCLPCWRLFTERRVGWVPPTVGVPPASCVALLLVGPHLSAEDAISVPLLPASRMMNLSVFSRTSVCQRLLPGTMTARNVFKVF